MGEDLRGEEAIKRNGFGDLSVVLLDLESATPVKLESEDSNNNNNNSNGVERSELDVVPPPLLPCDHKHYSHRSPWLRAMVLGANDGLISVASLMLGVGAVNNDVKSMVVSGLAGLVAGACSMAIGEFVSVFSQRDSELADVEKERQAHARDELGIDMDDLSNPMQAAVASAVAFSLGAAIPLLAGSFIVTTKYRIISIVLTSTMALTGFGAIGAKLGGASMTKAAMRVLIGGWIAMLITYGVLRLCNLIGV
ncbi:unnamed protein product [Sphagnum jensenii]|uniref:Uncharacterized protein n=2 Tax=Sphagnum jensenii TaxID=128206 RepID=A0ABP1C2H1_9BRYO